MQQNWTDRQIWDQDMAWLRKSSVVVAECTVTSLGVGYELGIAEELKLPILCLFRGSSDKLSAMITGNPHIMVGYYKELPDAKVIIDQFMHKLQQ
ncbi:hypothetical protein BC833DRAFT_587878 [Globomyces pollinis-pini]|nr:hypothetical protein BC833DRAFT_587878 [Globomyces pollinis-pini]